MNIEQFRYSSDNLGYLVYSGSCGMAIDGGAADAMIEFAGSRRIRIKYVTNTHTHNDHTTGNADLLSKTNAEWIDCKTITSDRLFDLDGESVKAFPTPGHTRDSVTFAADHFLVTGDTLFNGTVGNCFSGDLRAFFQSLKRLMAFPGTTRIYAGHDYVEESMKYARMIEPENTGIDDFLNSYSSDPVASTLADEIKANPYIRFNAPEMIENLKQKNVKTDSEFERFEAIMELY